MVPSDELKRALFDEYVAERRSAAIPGFSVEALPHITRYMPVAPGGEGMVMYARLPEADAVRRIRAEIETFAKHRQALEWKVYDLDRPANLRSLLEAEGFAAHHDEVFMVRALEDESPGEVSAPAGVAIVRADHGNTAIEDIVKVQEDTWDCAFPALAAQLRKALGPDTAVYCAYLDGAPVGTGWIDFTEGSRFADLHGGAVLSSARGRGIYTLLYRRRAEDARARGCGFMAVDAAPMSRPILEHKGFMHVCNTYPMRSAPHPKR